MIYEVHLVVCLEAASKEEADGTIAALQAYLAKIGIRVEIPPTDPNEESN